MRAGGIFHEHMLKAAAVAALLAGATVIAVTPPTFQDRYRDPGARPDATVGLVNGITSANR